jgi:hypothetical protein
MAKYSDAEREAILEQSWELMQRANDDEKGTLITDEGQGGDQPTPMLASGETRNQRDARELGERDREWAARRIEGDIADATAKARTNAMNAATRAAWNEWADARIRNYTDEVTEIVAEEVFKIIGEESAATLAECREELSKLHKLHEEVATLRDELKALREKRTLELSEPLDVPTFLRN